jgi:membrane protein implicated in regulation of membrane protease activity
MQPIGKTLILIGLGIAVIGVLLHFAGDKFNWFGNLPGDVKYKTKNVSFYAPWVSMLLISLLVSFLMWVFRKFF